MPEVKPSEKPILFSSPMVRAILDGRKTMARRIIAYGNSDICRHIWDRLEWDDSKIPARFGPNFVDGSLRRLKKEPRPCDYLHVATRPHPSDPQHEDFWTRNRIGSRIEPGDRLWVKEKLQFGSRMPRWASRITLEVTAVGAERVNSITTDDIVAEGFHDGTFNPTMGERWHNDMRCKFIDLWDKLNAGRGYSWASNPWVWCVTFKRLDVTPTNRKD